jgi:hypothetical protein
MTMKWLRLGSSGLEVAKWQNFLCGFFPSSRTTLHADGDFGPATLDWTKKFQQHVGLTPDGTVGNQTLGIAARYGFPLVTVDDDESGPEWPACPKGVSPLSDQQREALFGRFSYVADPTDTNPEGIKITDDWVHKNIIHVTVPQLVGVSNAPKNGSVRIHEKLQDQFTAMFDAWEREGLMKHVRTWNGSFVPRFIRGSRSRLSNHSWGTAFDLNVQWNSLGSQGALKGQVGSVRELALTACEHGFYWGGWYRTRLDLMHFEAYKII